MRWLLALAILLAIILKIWPRGLWLVLAAALLIGTGAFYLNSLEEKKLAMVRVEVAYAPQVCQGKKPLEVTIVNGADATLDRVLFSIQAQLPGYSNVVTPYTYKQFDSAKILEPGESFAACYPPPVLSRTPAADVPLGDLEWTAVADRAYFQ